MQLGLAGRLIWFGTLAAVLVALAGGLALRTGVHAAVRESFALRLAEHAERIAARLELDEVGRYTQPSRADTDEFGRIFSGWYWRVEGTAETLRSRSLWDARLHGVSRQAGDLLSGFGPQDTKLLGIERPLDGQNGSARLQVFGPSEQVDDALHRLDRILMLMFAALLALLAIISVVQVRLGLRPLSRLRQALVAMEQGGRERVGSGYGPDLDPLARELDEVLAHNARIVARARGHAADLAHALKKPLALLTAASGEPRVPASLVQREAQTMSRLIDRHLARAGSGAGERRRLQLAPRIAALLELMGQLHGARGLIWEMEVPDDLHWRGEATDLEEMLGNLLDNAGKWARSRVKLRAAASDIHAAPHGAGLCIEVSDDGPGLTDSQMQEAMQRGRRFDESTEGNGLGLAIVSDIIATYEGWLELGRGDDGGLRARLWLPG
jgi:signal transduction histidine kinase